jgi:hypothetical protein
MHVGVGSIGDRILEPTGLGKLVRLITFARYCFLRGATPYQTPGRQAPPLSCQPNLVFSSTCFLRMLRRRLLSLRSDVELSPPCMQKTTLGPIISFLPAACSKATLRHYFFEAAQQTHV